MADQTQVVAPAEVKAGKRAKKVLVFESQENLAKAASAAKEARKAKNPDRKGTGGAKQWKVEMNGRTFFIMGGSAKDALGKAALHSGVKVERLDAEVKEKKARVVTADDITKLADDPTKIDPNEANKLREALKKLDAAMAAQSKVKK